MNRTERAELAGYLRVYAAEMEKEYGPAVSQELVKGLLSFARTEGESVIRHPAEQQRLKYPPAGGRGQYRRRFMTVYPAFFG